MSAAAVALPIALCAGALYEGGDWQSVWWLPQPGAVQPGKQVAVETGLIPHLMFVPAGEPPADGWPLLVFLHGQGESSGAAPLNKVALQGPPQHAGRHPETMKFAVLSPQKPLWSEFYADDVAANIMGTVDGYLASLKLDASRVYLTGLSQGGIGTWGLASDPRYAARFAAIAPVCGGLPGAMQRRAATLSDTPVWAFHGANDSILPVSMSDESVAALNKAQRTAYAGAPKFTRIEEARGEDYAWAAAGVPSMEGHASWVHAYYPPGMKLSESPPLYDWLLTFRRSPLPSSHGGAKHHGAKQHGHSSAQGELR